MLNMFKAKNESSWKLLLLALESNESEVKIMLDTIEYLSKELELGLGETELENLYKDLYCIEKYREELENKGITWWKH